MDSAAGHTYIAVIDTTGPATVSDSTFSGNQVTDAIFYLRTGRAKLTVVSPDGREATIALLSSGEFIGEESLRAWAGCI